MRRDDLNQLSELRHQVLTSQAEFEFLLRSMYESGRYNSAQLGSAMGTTDANVRMMARRKGWTRGYDRDRQAG